ncbi:MAG: hypothetical protein ACLSVD_01900 [Eggerthellaceae bacterium]
MNFGKPDQAEIDTMTIAGLRSSSPGPVRPSSMLPVGVHQYVRAFPGQGSHHVARVRRCRYQARRAPSSRRKAFCV